MLDLETAIALDSHYRQDNVSGILLKSDEIMQNLAYNWPLCPKSWYDQETIRRIKQLCRENYFKEVSS